MTFLGSIIVFLTSGDDMILNVLVFLQILERTKLVVFHSLECISPLIGFINIYTLSTNRNKYNTHTLLSHEHI